MRGKLRVVSRRETVYTIQKKPKGEKRGDRQEENKAIDDTTKGDRTTCSEGKKNGHSSGGRQGKKGSREQFSLQGEKTGADDSAQVKAGGLT